MIVFKSLRAVQCTIHHLPRRKWPISSFQKRTVSTYTSPHQAAQISILPSTLDTNSKPYRDNVSYMSSLIQNLSHLHAEAAKGGPEKARQKHLQRGKMLVRDRVTALIDPGTSFLELSALAGHGMYEPEDIAAGGIVTGVGTVEGVMCVIVANDSTYVSFRSISYLIRLPQICLSSYRIFFFYPPHLVND